jgi:hypothetical protein
VLAIQADYLHRQRLENGRGILQAFPWVTVLAEKAVPSFDYSLCELCASALKFFPG